MLTALYLTPLLIGGLLLLGHKTGTASVRTGCYVLLIVSAFLAIPVTLATFDDWTFSGMDDLVTALGIIVGIFTFTLLLAFCGALIDLAETLYFGGFPIYTQVKCTSYYINPLYMPFIFMWKLITFVIIKPIMLLAQLLWVVTIKFLCFFFYGIIKHTHNFLVYLVNTETFKVILILSQRTVKFCLANPLVLAAFFVIFVLDCLFLTYSGKSEVVYYVLYAGAAILVVLVALAPYTDLKEDKSTLGIYNSTINSDSLFHFLWLCLFFVVTHCALHFTYAYILAYLSLSVLIGGVLLLLSFILSTLVQFTGALSKVMKDYKPSPTMTSSMSSSPLPIFPYTPSTMHTTGSSPIGFATIPRVSLGHSPACYLPSGCMAFSTSAVSLQSSDLPSYITSRKRWNLHELVKSHLNAGGGVSIPVLSEVLERKVTSDQVAACESIFRSGITIPMPFPNTDSARTFTKLAGTIHAKPEVQRPGCYYIFSDDTSLSYVGQTVHLGKRVRTHAYGTKETQEFITASPNAKVTLYFLDDLITGLDLAQSLTLLEQYLFLVHNPTYNKILVATPGFTLTQQSYDSLITARYHTIYCYTKSGDHYTLVQTFPSGRKVAEVLGLAPAFYNNVRVQNKGWFRDTLFFTSEAIPGATDALLSQDEFKELYNSLKLVQTTNMPKGVRLTNIHTGEVFTFSSLADCRRSMNLTRSKFYRNKLPGDPAGSTLRKIVDGKYKLELI